MTPARTLKLSVVHIPTWVIAPAVKVGERLYDLLGNRVGIRVEADLGLVGQGPIAEDAVIVKVYNRTDKAEQVDGIYLGYSHGAGILYYTPGPGFPSFPPLPRPLTRTENVVFAFPLDQVKRSLADIRNTTGNPKIEVNRVRVDLASGRRVWRQAKLGPM